MRSIIHLVTLCMEPFYIRKLLGCTGFRNTWYLRWNWLHDRNFFISNLHKTGFRVVMNELINHFWWFWTRFRTTRGWWLWATAINISFTPEVWQFTVPKIVNKITPFFFLRFRNTNVWTNKWLKVWNQSVELIQNYIMLLCITWSISLFLSCQTRVSMICAYGSKSGANLFWKVLYSRFQFSQIWLTE